MSSSVSRRIFRSPEDEEDVFVVGETVRRYVPADGPVNTIADMLDGARRRAEAIVAAAQGEAAAIVAQAESEADASRATGFEAGFAAAEETAREQLDLIRTAAAEGMAVRDAMIEEALPAMARAVAMACRRVVGASIETDPTLTEAACRDAVRSAAGQEILSIRVNPSALDRVRAGLVDVAGYVQPDDSIELGGCIIDLRDGAIDATLDARLDLMELALRSAAGGAE